MIFMGELLSRYWGSEVSMMWYPFLPIHLILPIPYYFNSAWDKKTGPNAPLYDMEGGIPGFSAHSCVENWKAGGGRPAQM
jgi:hypothetical protein